MEKAKIEDIFLRERIVSVLREIQELNKALIDRDIERIENGTDLKECFSKKEVNEITTQYESKKTELDILISCSVHGFENTLKSLLTSAKEHLSEEECKDVEEFVNRLIKASGIEVEIGGEVN